MANSFEDVISQIKDRLDIVDVVSQYVVLKKSGANYWGLCPFHNDKKPSMSVSPTRGIFKCFSCGAGGDALNFLVRIQNREYKDVILELAEKYGIELPTKYHASADTTKTEAAEFMLQLQEQVAGEVIEHVYEIINTYQGKGNRWYDSDPMMLKAVELLRNAPPKVQRVAALKLLIALEQKSFEGVEI